MFFKLLKMIYNYIINNLALNIYEEQELVLEKANLIFQEIEKERKKLFFCKLSWC